jgi:hypothetical protein
MDKASNSLAQTPLRSNGLPIHDGRQTLLESFAMFAARNHIKLQLKREGYVLSHYPSTKITAMANDYLEANRERLMEETQQRIINSVGLRAMWDAEGRKYERALAARARREAEHASALKNGDGPFSYFSSSQACR